MSEHFQSGFMQRALELARLGEGRTAPNPPVGAVIVQQNQIVGEGFHPCAGEPHAEIFALQQAGEQAQGADLYVTLEPCSHHGRTGPCVDALLAARVKRVFVGVEDPNPKVAGRGIAGLQAAGVQVELGLQEKECHALIAPFKRHISSGCPYTIYKSAMTLDGKTATPGGDSKWISGEQSRLSVHRLRDRVEAIMIGVETLLNDDPRLTTRLPDGEGRDPLRVVVDSRLRTPCDCHLLTQNSTAQTLIATTAAAADEKIEALLAAGAEVIILPERNGRVSLPDLWLELGRRNVQRLLLEGGATLAGAALNAGLIDQMWIFVAPRILGGDVDFGIFSGQGHQTLATAVELQNLHTEASGGDLLIRGDVKRCLLD